MTQSAVADAFTAHEWVIYVGLPVLGVVVGHLWTRYRGRLKALRWAAQFQPLAFATDDFGWGKVEILYNGAPAGTLHVVNVQVSNDSQTDLANVELDLQTNEGTFVIRSAAIVRGAANGLVFAPAYAGALASFGHGLLTPLEVANWSRRSDFVVPVLNRGDVVDARLLVQRKDYLPPTVSVTCNHLGVRIKHQKPAQQFWGVNQALASWVGFFVGLGVVYATVRAGGATWSGALVPWLTGACGVLVGAALTKGWRWLSRMAG